jgi:hypothetical protein
MVLTDVKPFGLRITVVDPPTQSETDSGLILPLHILESDLSVGVILELPSAFADSLGRYLDSDYTAILRKGMLIYYRKGCEFMIRDTKVVDLSDIVAYEEM